MRIGIFAKTFPGRTAEAALAAARAAGFDTVQFNMACLGLPSMPDAIAEADAASVAAASEATGVSLAAVSATYNMIHPDPAVRAAGLGRLAVIAAAARPMGTRLLTLCTGTRDPDDPWRGHPDNDRPEAFADLLAEMEKALAVAERHDVDLGVEPELANVISSAARARDLLDAMASPRLKIVLDPANLFDVAAVDVRRRILADAVEALGPAVAMAHAKDRDPTGGFVAAGTGVIDFPAFLADLRAAGFDGPVVTHGCSAEEAPAVARFLRDILGDGR